MSNDEVSEHAERPVACTCAYCHDDIIEGTEAWSEAWRVIGGNEAACSLWCLVRLTEDVDEFSKEIITAE